MLRALLARNPALDPASVDAGGNSSPHAADSLLGRVTTAGRHSRAAARGARAAIEAVPESAEPKKSILRAVEDQVAPDLLASNASSLSIDDLADAPARPERFLDLHFFNPVRVMALVEIVRGPRTGDHVLAAALALVVRIGKEPPARALSRWGPRVLRPVGLAA